MLVKLLYLGERVIKVINDRSYVLSNISVCAEIGKSLFQLFRFKIHENGWIREHCFHILRIM